jgi:DNA-binding transcriptional ArsR family regulator
MNIQTMETAAKDVSGILKLLSNPNRLLIVCQLVEEEKSVGELARLIGASQVTVSQQLSLLKNTGVVTSRREAQTIFYRLDHDEIKQLVEFLYSTFCPAEIKALPNGKKRSEQQL